MTMQNCQRKKLANAIFLYRQYGTKYNVFYSKLGIFGSTEILKSDFKTKQKVIYDTSRHRHFK